LARDGARSPHSLIRCIRLTPSAKGGVPAEPLAWPILASRRGVAMTVFVRRVGDQLAAGYWGEQQHPGGGVSSEPGPRGWPSPRPP
jgi:hypothetical protein